MRVHCVRVVVTAVVMVFVLFACFTAMVQDVRTNQGHATNYGHHRFPQVTQLFVGEKSSIGDNDHPNSHPDDGSPLTVDTISADKGKAGRA